MAIRMRRGLESELDISQAVPGEWLVSTDTRYIRMCFAPGIVLRMATYESFEEDMEEIQKILDECQTIEEAVSKIYEEIKDVAVDVERIESAAESAFQSEQNALSSANNASDFAYISSEKANIAIDKAEEAENNAKISEEKALEATNAAGVATSKAEETEQNANNAENMADISKSYAVGDTGVRLGEDIDNSKYYSEVAKTESDKATTEADRAKAEADRAQGLVGGDFVTNSQIKEYSLIKDTGYELGLSIDNTNYVMTVQLKNANGSVLSEKTIDFPIESMVINATYSNGVITLTLQNGTTLPVDVSALVSGLVKNTFTIAGIDMKDNITSTELKKALGLNNVANVTVNNQSPTFTQASERVNIASGEKLSVLFGKIMKWFADLKTIAFSGSYNDLSNRPAIPTKVSELENDSGYATDEELKKTTELVAINKQTLGYGKKNLLKVTAATRTIKGITFTVNSDGSVTAKGTNDGTGASIFITGTVKLKKGTYIVSGCPKNGHSDTYRVDLRYGSAYDKILPGIYDIGNSKIFTLTEEMELAYCARIGDSTAYDNLTFYPMIRSVDIEDGTYEPYVDDVDTRLDKIDNSILNTLEEIEANTDPDMIASALAVKELYNLVKNK